MELYMLLPTPSKVATLGWPKLWSVVGMHVSAWSTAYCSTLLMSVSMCDMEVAASRERCNEQKSANVSACTEA